MAIPGAILLAGLLIAGAVIYQKQPSTLGIDDSGTSIVVNINDVATSSSPYIGKPDAPVTIAFWADYQCPFCKAVEVGHPDIPIDPAIPQIIANYVDSGKVKIVFKDLAFLGPDSQTAALYARAVWELYPSKYFDWRTAMYQAQDEEHGGFGDETSVQTLTKGVAGIDAAKVIAAVKANKSAYEALIAADLNEAHKLGLNSTPSFVIGTKAIIGAQPYSAFEAAIKAALK